MPRRIGQPNVNTDTIKTDPAAELTQALEQNPALMDSAESPNYVAANEVEEEDKATFILPEDLPPSPSAGHGILSAEEYKGFSPDIKVTTRKEGFTSEQTKEHLGGGSKPRVRPANEADLENFDESSVDAQGRNILMMMPSIKAADFNIPNLLHMKPKSPSIRFRWVNYKNFVQGNMGKYIAMGFSIAGVEDVNTDITPVDDSMKDGTMIKWYDVVLMKIEVMKLMSIYKSNIIKSLTRIGRYKENGLAEANRQFNSDITNDPKLMNGLSRMRAANGGRDPIAFYDPSVETAAQ